MQSSYILRSIIIEILVFKALCSVRNAPKSISVGACKIKTKIGYSRIFQAINPGVLVNYLGYMEMFSDILHFGTPSANGFAP